MKRFWRFAAIVVATVGAGAIGWSMTDASVNSWYASLHKPALTPANGVFGIAWTILYLLMIAAASLAWLRKKQDDHTRSWVRFYFIQLMFNAGWTVFFFGYHAVVLALMDIFLLLFMVVGLTASAFDVDKRVAYLMMPYAAWLFFALYLNLGIWILN